MLLVTRNLLTNKFCFLLTAGFFSITQCNTAEAHGIESSLNYLNGNLVLQSIFSNGEPVKGATVRIMKSYGVPQKKLGNINEFGKLILSIPNIIEGDLDIQIDGGSGHRDYLLLPIRSGKVLIDQVVSEPFKTLELIASTYKTMAINNTESKSPILRKNYSPSSLVK